MSAPFSSARRYRDGVRSGWYDETVENAVSFFFSMKGFSCSAISSSSFPFSLSVPVFSSSVALLRRFPYCSYRWHIRAITPSYRQDKRNAPFRPALRSSDTMPLSGLSRASSRPLVSSGGAFFHHLIGSSRLAVSLSHPFHLVSFHVSNDSGARSVSFRASSRYLIE